MKPRKIPMRKDIVTGEMVPKRNLCVLYGHLKAMSS